MAKCPVLDSKMAQSLKIDAMKLSEWSKRRGICDEKMTYTK